MLLAIPLLNGVARAQGAGVEVAIRSQLTGITLPPGAMRIRDQAIVAAAAKELTTQAEQHGKKALNTELLTWSGEAYKPNQAEQITSLVAERLRKAGYKTQELPGPSTDAGRSRLVVAVSRNKGIMGLWALTPEFAALSWCEMADKRSAAGPAPSLKSPTARPTSPPRAAGTTRPSRNAKGLDGIYFGLRRMPSVSGSPIMDLRRDYITFFPDGRLFWRLPGSGRDGFDFVASRKAFPEEWGTYKIVGNEVHINHPERSRMIKARRKPDGRLDMDDPNVTYRPVLDLSGLKLHGTYRRSPSDPSITFTRDGKFEDQGFLGVVGTMQTNDGTLIKDSGEPGSGTYEIRSNTLHLEYSDGRSRKVVIYAFPENLVQPSPSRINIFREGYERQ
jgi:hypothetical protein